VKKQNINPTSPGDAKKLTLFNRSGNRWAEPSKFTVNTSELKF